MLVKNSSGYSCAARLSAFPSLFCPAEAFETLAWQMVKIFKRRVPAAVAM